jgi:NADH-quinone oxidoreductase subunit L
MLTIPTLLVLVPALPLLAAAVTAALGPRVLRERSHIPVVAAIGLSCLASIVLLLEVRSEANLSGAKDEQVGYEKTVTLWSWADVEGAYDQADPIGVPGGTIRRDFDVQIVLRADTLTASMLAMVTFVSFLVAVYSIGYMHGERGYWRFFSYIGLFVFSMTMLVSVSNFLLLYVFWEAVGLCSYLLIGFWYEKPSAAAAGKKAFLVNRVGDFGFALGVFLIWTSFGTLNFHDSGGVPGVLGQTLLANPALYQAYIPGGVATAICLLLMLGACGKSAQFPLHVWLPDAMEGPSPVSALIHAATMVTAGVYMVARCTPLFLSSPDAQMAVAAIGGFTALLAGVIAVTQTDLKRILAYSTISQLGYMFLGVGAGTFLGVTAGMFHLFTHAFFKALLFLGAGSVMHAMGGVIDVREFGGLRRRMPTTHWTFLFGCLALAGFPLFSGFFSKDEILAAVHAKGGPLYEGLYWAAVATALLTAFYTFRAFFLTFYGEERIPPQAGHHAHESPRVMTVPLVVLAVGAAAVGAWLYFADVGGLLALTPSLSDSRLAAGAHAAEVAHGGAEGGSHLAVMVTSSLVALAGIALAWILYPGREAAVRRLAWLADRAGLYSLSHNKFFFDELYNVLVVWPLLGLARLSYWLDRYVVDAVVNTCGRVPLALGATLRSLQGGMLQFYALAMVLGLLVLIGVLLW